MSIRIRAIMAERPPDSGIQHAKTRYVRAVHRKKFDTALDIALVKPNQFPALIIAIDNNCVELAETLMNLGWDVNEKRGVDGATPLHAAVFTRSEALLKSLLNRGAVPGKRDGNGDTALARSMAYHQDGVARRLTETLISVTPARELQGRNEHGETILFAMAKNVSVPLPYYRYMLNKGIDVNVQDIYAGRNFIMELVMAQGAEDRVIRVTEMAMSKGLDINHTDHFGNSLLHRAASEEYRGLIQWLIEKGARIGDKNATGQTAAWIAAKRGNRRILECLYGAGEELSERGRVFPHGATRSVMEIARHGGHHGLARSISKELGEEWTEQGQRIIPTLQRLAKITVRRALTADGTCIRRKLTEIECPRSLREFLVTMES